MSASDTEVQAGQGAARRRRPGRPPTVPLAEFGKEPPPPPPIQLNPRNVAIGLVISTIVLSVLWVGIVWAGQIADARWSRAGCVDVRQC